MPFLKVEALAKRYTADGPPVFENIHFGIEHGEFACIEPESGECFLGKTLDEAVNKALDAYPDRLTHTLRVGHAAALHLGVMFQ